MAFFVTICAESLISGMEAHENSWIEGPLIRYLGQDKTCLSYFSREGKQEFVLAVKPADQRQRVSGALHDKEKTYPLLQQPTPAEAEQDGIARILLIGDLHGNHDKLLQFLQAQQIIDAKGEWCWGEGQLVFCGDVMDRGLKVLPLLWLLCRLEQQAAEAGGAVHVLLGNHELMVMQEDYRYVHPRLLYLYAKAGMAYGEPYGPDWYLGQWLRSRNSVLRLNNLLISHAGISPAVARQQLSIAEINKLVRAAIDKGRPSEQQELLTTAQGPLWYRGYLMDHPYYAPASQAQTEAVLAYYDAKALVVAHTTVPYIQQRLDGKLWAIDLDIESPAVEVQGLLVEHDQYFVLLANGSRKAVASF